MHCGFEPPPQDCLELDYDDLKENRRAHLLNAVDLRRGTDNLTGPERFSSGFIVEQAAQRYFSLLDDVQAQMKDMFSSSEFLVILNAECTPVCDWYANMSVTTMVADDNGIDSLDDLKKGSSMRGLLEKLIALSPIENAALIDACERVWRGYPNPLL